MEAFRALLRDRMKARGAQARLAEASGIPSPVLGRWRDGEGRPTDTNLRKLAPALGESYERLAVMCGYMPDDTEVPELDPIEALIRQRTDEMREAVRDTPQQFWATIIRHTFDRAIDGARDMANLLASAGTNNVAPSETTDVGAGQQDSDVPARRKPEIQSGHLVFSGPI